MGEHIGYFLGAVIKYLTKAMERKKEGMKKEGEGWREGGRAGGLILPFTLIQNSPSCWEWSGSRSSADRSADLTGLYLAFEDNDILDTKITTLQKKYVIFNLPL